ncbi:MAG: hypothetical protein ACI93P_002633, partial [bacterium]
SINSESFLDFKKKIKLLNAFIKKNIAFNG